MPFRVPVPKFLGEFNGKISSECISYNLEFQTFPGENPCTPRLQERGKTPVFPLSCSPPLAPAALGSCLRHSTLPYFINWDSYFNSFWEPCLLRTGGITIACNTITVQMSMLISIKEKQLNHWIYVVSVFLF